MSEFYERSFFEKETCENISNFIYLPTEDDDYAKCVGDALRKCIYEDIILFEHRVSTVEEESKFSECMKGQAKTCTAPMMQHLMSQSTAYKKHMEELYESEENYRA